MTALTSTESVLAELMLLRDGGRLREGVARRHGRRRNPARRAASELAPNTHQPAPTPRSPLA